MSLTEVLLQQALNGLTIGAYLALIALGYTMVYGIIELINFAHGDLFTFGFLISLTLFRLYGAEGTLYGFELIWMFGVVLALTMLLTGILNVAIDRVAYRPLRKAPRLAPLITAVGMSFALQNIFANWYGPSQINYPDFFPRVDILREWFGMDTNILFTTQDLLLIGVTIPLMIGLRLFVQRTKLGKAMRATAQNANAAAIMGIDVERVIMITFFIGGAMAGAAGMIFGNFLHTGRYLMGFDAGLFAFTAAVFGGIGNITGALLGGFIIGFIKAFSDQYLAAQWTRAVIFGILILVLVFRPQGLLGQGEAEKA
ncbi:MAG: branched-chain amino acid ABC transporter permease [Caldilineaceae bacterium]|nr:branched-chain amino acid ABC transporter permease [Caldilineaceae bacterium]MBP8106861.1 branched-chain amino acid ABC transporter permease [Caldilineaceae bacterium]MBP8122449.1 branched-chain amino acid ABC transporter permease [Caldilineaceae bacterium]MBP9072229.1 branched-chain amino acid ABC transporter permease [Caldilineaceae bacterium]